jgi:hypothetical protein
MEGSLPWIPEGYILVMGPDQQPYVVPEFFVSALHQNFDGYKKKESMEVSKAAGTVSCNVVVIYPYRGKLFTTFFSARSGP